MSNPNRGLEAGSLSDDVFARTEDGEEVVCGRDDAESEGWTIIRPYWVLAGDPIHVLISREKDGEEQTGCTEVRLYDDWPTEWGPEIAMIHVQEIGPRALFPCPHRDIDVTAVLVD